ncbi:MAG TPA: hypothetical protein VMS76_00370 [Planctomycetota bacterium]|nr:hypothetical protein [Planctomycetota bacterium]
MFDPRTAVRPQGAAPRILLYSHDSWGLGHLRRSLTLAGGLVERFPAADVLIATGSPCATQFPLPERVEVVKLPSVSKDGHGAYVPRSLGCGLDAVLDLRSSLLLALCRSFAPSLLVVDHQVLGLRRELLEVLIAVKRRGARTILGLRDILDTPARVAEEWASPEVQWALEEGYDRLCVYGVPEVFDPRCEYRLPPRAAARTAFMGYVVRPGKSLQGVAGNGKRDDSGSGHDGNGNGDHPPRRPRVLVTVGGGEDGCERIERYLDAIALAPTHWDSTIITGPLMPNAQVRSLKQRAVRMRGVLVRRFHADLPSLMRQSAAVVAMCGYNISAEILQSRRPAIFLPRTFPRSEQLLRALRFSHLGLSQCLVDPRPQELRGAIARALTLSSPAGYVPSLDGCLHLCESAAELLGESSMSAAGVSARPLP